MLFTCFRVKKVLPNSNKHCQRVIYLLANSYCPSVLKNTTTSQRPRVSSDIQATIVSFYLREDVSITMPGHADCMVVRNGHKKEVMQKWFLTMSLKETYAHFVEENGKIVSFSYFCEQQPTHVLLFGDIPHNVCACRKHEDFIS
jgi:hypothetical protein